jgi:hypothetical protein
MKYIFTLVCLFCISYNLFCQVIDSIKFDEPPSSVSEVINQLNSDTIVFFYNDRWQLVKPICATIFRISRLDTTLLTFKGKFVDYYLDSTKAVEGYYANGKKEGTFNIYYPNGQIEQSGNYINDKKSGVWDYFYDNGKKRQVLDFKDTVVFINEFWNEDGKKMVDSGTGKWFAFETSEKFTKIEGSVLNGRKNGIWKRKIPSMNSTMNIEKYKDGIFISGKIISIVRGTETYKDTIYCSIEQNPAFLGAEQFQINRCFKFEKNNWEFAEYPGGIDQFYKEIKEKMNLNASTFIRGIIKIQITIDSNGIMTNFQPITNIGLENELIRVLQTMRKWKPTKVNGRPTIQPKTISFRIL